MVTPLAATGPHPPAARFRRDRAASLGVAASIAVHAAVGAALVTMTFHPFRLAQPEDAPPIITVMTPDPTRPQTPPKPAPPPVPIHAPLAPAPLTVQPLLVPQIDLPPQPTISEQKLVLGPAAPPTPTTPPPTRPTTITDPDWIARPGADQMSKVYPDRAADQGLGGEVTLACQVTAVGGVADCRAMSETPHGFGFAHAALGLAPYFKMKPRTENGQPVGGAQVLIPIRFAMAAGG